MRLNTILFTILILSGTIPIVYAHPDQVFVTVQNQNGTILYTNELGIIIQDESEFIELFTGKWFYHNFIAILTSLIIAIVVPISIVSYKEDIQSLIFN